MKILILLLFCPLAILGQTIGKVIAITDGDTFTILKDDSIKIKVRFHGIDCPESGQPYSKVCKSTLSELIFQKEVVINNKKDWLSSSQSSLLFLCTSIVCHQLS